VTRRHTLLATAPWLAVAIACSQATGPSGGDAGGSDAGGGDAPSLTCDPGLTACNGACVDTQTDSTNCGGCGTTCALSCSGGQCVTSCPSPQIVCGGTCVNPSATLSGDVQPILTGSCALAGCHAGAKPQQNMLLTSGNTYKNVVNVSSAECSSLMRVAPNQVDQSYLMDKLLGKNMCSGTQMPKTGSSLSTAQLGTIRSWICSGAPNN
jgi:hypothetical protein